MPVSSPCRRDPKARPTRFRTPLPPDKLEDKYNHVLGPRCESSARREHRGRSRGVASRRGCRRRSGMRDTVLDGGRGDGEASPRAEGCRPKELRTVDLHPPARASSSAIRGCRLVSQHAVAVSRGGLAPLACCSRSIPTSALCKSPKARPTCSREIQSAQVHPGHDRASVGQGGQGSEGGVSSRR